LEKNLGKASPYYSSILNGKATSKGLQGHFSESQGLYLQALEKIEKEGTGKYSHDYVRNLNGLGKLYIDMGKLPEAELILSDALNILDRSGDDDTPAYRTILNNLAVVYVGLGFYEQSADLFSKIIDQDKQLYGEEDPKYTIPLGNQASVLAKMGKYDQAEKNYNQALKIFEQIGDTKNSDYAILLKEKALLYQKTGKQQEALGLLQKAVDLQKEILGEDHPEYAKALFNLGNHYLSMGNEDAAGALLERSMEIRKELLGENHPDFAQSLRKMAIYYWKEGNYKEADQLFFQTFANYFNQIEAFFPTLSEAEKAKFYNTKLKITFEEFNSYAVERSQSNPNLIDQMYDYQLATKALIMYATNKVRENILSSRDTELIGKYNQWIAHKEELSKLYSLSLDELNQRNRDLDELQRASNQLEKELGAASSTFARTYEQNKLSWRDIQLQLKANEAAIEIIRFRKFKPDSSGIFTDDVFYAALIVTKQTREHPFIVVIGNGRAMETRYLANYRNTIRFKSDDEHSYRVFWQSIAEKLTGIKKIYVSPDGVYNQVNIGTFKNPESGRYLIDEYQVHLLSNTKDLVALSQLKLKSGKNQKALLIGYPNYNLGLTVDSTANQSLWRDQLRSLRGFMGLRREENVPTGALQGDISLGLKSSLIQLTPDGQHITMLPGTKREVQFIAEKYAQQNLTFDSLLYDRASEEALKSVRNVQTLHIATHGFFIEDTSPTEDHKDSYVENPMLRSGLILAGANRLIADVTLGEDQEDGILTAYEAMNLHLEQTDLVVLSACETGLGEVKNGEGVYGLQRAFLVAGANTIIMSLWSVDDDATQQLMNYFYDDYLKSRKKFKAFSDALHKMKNSHPDPFYWGAFVMIGG